jgi:hypothetical protein
MTGEEHNDRQTRTKLLGTVVLVVMFAAGGVTGAVLQRYATADNAPPRRGPQRGRSVFEALKLTDAQQQVCTILAAKGEEMSPHEMAFDSARKAQWPARHAIDESTNAAVDSVLTAEQRAEKERFLAERDQYFPPAPGAGISSSRSPKGSDGSAPRGGRRGRNMLGVSYPDVDVSRGQKPPWSVVGKLRVGLGVGPTG